MDTTTKIYVGVDVGDNRVKEVELLRSNGVAERIYAAKYPDKPYSWMANVLSAGIASIGGEIIGSSVREHYAKHETVIVPPIIKRLPMADVSTLLLEIHRKTWRNILQRQKIVCQMCGQSFVMDIDLDRMVLSEEDAEKVDLELPFLVYDMKDGFVLTSLGKENRIMPELVGTLFNRIVFRIPTLADAINNEKHYTDGIMFWRRIAYDCIQSIQAVSGLTVTAEMPENGKVLIGLGKLFNEFLSQDDLFGIRELMREELPTLPFYYEEDCPLCHRRTPMSLEASNFFSD